MPFTVLIVELGNCSFEAHPMCKSLYRENPNMVLNLTDCESEETQNQMLALSRPWWIIAELYLGN